MFTENICPWDCSSSIQKPCCCIQADMGLQRIEEYSLSGPHEPMSLATCSSLLLYPKPGASIKSEFHCVTWTRPFLSFSSSICVGISGEQFDLVVELLHAMACGTLAVSSNTFLFAAMGSRKAHVGVRMDLMCTQSYSTAAPKPHRTSATGFHLA